MLTKMDYSTKINYDDHDYTIKSSTDSKKYYRCSVYRSTNCKATLNVDIKTGNLFFFLIKGVFRKGIEPHVCKKREIDSLSVDVSYSMKEKAKELAFDSMALSAKKIWNKVSEEVEKEKGSHGNVVKKQVFRKSEMLLKLFENHFAKLKYQKK
jgi:hypothetical protein